MPAEAPVINAVPLVVVVLMVSSPLSPRRIRACAGRSRLAGRCLKCHINDVLGHCGGGSMQRIGFIVFPGFQVMGFAVISAFEFANVHVGEPVYEVQLLSESGGTIRASMGMSVVAEAFSDAKFDTLILGGGTTIEPSTPGLIEFVRQAPGRYRRIAATCTGAFILAE